MTRTVTYTVLVVDADRRALSEATTALADTGFLVSQASTFADARQRLVLLKPDVLITAVRLGGFNGVHLVVSARRMLPDAVAVVTHGVDDAALRSDALQYNAMYLVQPVDWTIIGEAIHASLAAHGERPRPSRPRRWTRKTPADRVDATLGLTPGCVVDLSYGGIRLQMSGRVAAPPDEAQTLALPAAGLAVHARPVWLQGASLHGSWWCGMEVQESDPTVDRAWRAFVDGVAP